MSNFFNFPVSTLILSTSSASSNALLTSHTWSNINMRLVLGDLFDKYDLFNIVLVEVGTAVGASNLGSTSDDRAVEFVMSGLNFINARYYLQRQTVLNQSIIGVLNYQQSASSMQEYSGNNVSTFDKSSIIVNISINYQTIGGEISPNSPIAFPNTCFIFKIIPIPKDNIAEIDTSRRIKF